jgi:hypothetical protein
MGEGEKSSYLKALHPSHRPSPPPTLDLTLAVPDATSLPVLLLTKSEGDAGRGRGEGRGGGREGVEGVEDTTEEREWRTRRCSPPGRGRADATEWSEWIGGGRADARG